MVPGKHGQIGDQFLLSGDVQDLSDGYYAQIDDGELSIFRRLVETDAPAAIAGHRAKLLVGLSDAAGPAGIATHKNAGDLRSRLRPEDPATWS